MDYDDFDKEIAIIVEAIVIIILLIHIIGNNSK